MSSHEPQPPASPDDLTPAEALFLRTIGLPGPDAPPNLRLDPPASSEEALRLLDGYRASEWLESTRVEFDAELPEALSSPASVLRMRIGPYRVRRLLGRSGSTAVYKAWQSHPVPRWVALKVLFDAEEGSETLERFRREQAVLSRMDHPSIARLLDAGAHGDAAWFAMEFVDGDWITRFGRERRLPRRERVRLVRDAARAVEHAHARGVIHRDLKPSNVLASLPRRDDPAESARVVVIDFGIARGMQGRLRRLAAITHGAPLLGTLASMAPEQITRGHGGTDVRTDVFALGTILHELASDRPIRDLDAGTLPDLVAEIVGREPPPLRSLDASIDRDLEAIAAKSLRLDPTDRYQTAAALADDLDRWLAGEAVAARHSAWHERGRRWLRRHRRATAIGLASASLVVLAAAVGSRLAEQRTQDRIRRLASIEQTLAEVDRLREVAGTKDSRQMLLLSLDAQSELLLRADPRDPRATGLRAEVLRQQVQDQLVGSTDHLPPPDLARMTEEMVGLRRRAIELGDASPEALERLSIALVHDGNARRPDPEAARRRFLEALAIDESLHAANPSVRRLHDNLAWSHHRLATLAREEGRGEEAESRFAAAREVALSLLAAHPESPFSHLALGAASGFLGVEVALQERIEEAEALLREAVDRLEVAVDLAPLSPVFLIYRVALTHDLAAIALLTERPAEARSILDQLPASSPVLREDEGWTTFLEKYGRRSASLRAGIAIALGEATEAARRLEELRGIPAGDGSPPSLAPIEVEIMLLEGRWGEAAERLARLLSEARGGSGEDALDPVASGRRLIEVLAVAACLADARPAASPPLESASPLLNPEVEAAMSALLAETLDALAARPVDDLDADAVEAELRVLATELARLRGDDAIATMHCSFLEALPPSRSLESAVRRAIACRR